MKISIVMATYNGAQYLQEQLDSFVAQTRQPDELVITDDGSSDGTLDITRAFAQTAPFEVRWWQNEHNLGYAQNFNRALSRCTGDLVFLSDQDDVWFPQKIQTVKSVAEQDVHNVVFINDAELTCSDLSKTGLTKLSQIRSAGISYSSFIMGCCVAIKGYFLQEVLPIPKYYEAHDEWIVKLAETLTRKRVILQSLQLYRRHNTTESNYFIANKTRSINKLDRLLWRIGFTASENRRKILDKSLVKTEQMLKRLKEMSRKGERSNQYLMNLKTATQSLENKLRIQKARSELLKQPYYIRVLRALEIYRKGDYNHVAGLRSFIRDIT